MDKAEKRYMIAQKSDDKFYKSGIEKAIFSIQGLNVIADDYKNIEEAERGLKHHVTPKGEYLIIPYFLYKKG